MERRREGTRTRSAITLPVGAYKAPARPSSGISPGRTLTPSEPDSRPAKDFSESGSLRYGASAANMRHVVEGIKRIASRAAATTQKGE